MQIGTPIKEYFGSGATFADVARAVTGYADTLSSLADEGIYHRDIKPSNLYWANGSFAIGDFGIADFPDKAGLTQTGNRLGPANFLAPEMIQYAGDISASGPADVYSLGKTLSALAAGREHPPPGELRRDRPPLRISRYVEDPRARAPGPGEVVVRNLVTSVDPYHGGRGSVRP